MTYLDSLVCKTTTMILRWHGHPAAIFELTKSHSRLSIVVFGDEYGENLLISCLARNSSADLPGGTIPT